MNSLNTRNDFTKWLVISMVIHLVVISAGTYLGKKRRIDRVFYAPVYKVNLVSLDTPKPFIDAKPGRASAGGEIPEGKVAVAEVTKKEAAKDKPKAAEVKEKGVAKAKTAAPATAKKGSAKTSQQQGKVAPLAPEPVDTNAAIAAIRKEMEPALAVDRIREKLGSRQPSGSGEMTGQRGGSEKTMVTSGLSKAGVKNAGFEEMDKALQQYYDTVWEMIEGGWVLPGTGNFKGMTAIISVIIAPGGHLIDVSIEEGSGNGFYDQSAMRAVKKAQPFPPLPEGYNKGMAIGFRFKQ